ncbi:hypothetical protein Tco_0917556, partial [Tanacetum coccineum]
KVVSIAKVTTASAITTTVDELTLAQTLIEIKAAKPKAVTTVATTTTTTVTRPKASGVVVQDPIIKDMFDKAFKRVNTFVDYKTEFVKDDAKVDGDQEEARMKELMNIVLNEEDVAINDIPLATKPPCIVEKRYPLTPVTITGMLNKKLQADH